MTLGLVVDEQGFAKSSNLYGGNMSESRTLESMIKDMEEKNKEQRERPDCYYGCRSGYEGEYPMVEGA